MKQYTAKGLVWGNLWGGGTGGYRSKTVEGLSWKELKEKATDMLKDGSLDGGMGYESLYGAILNVKIEDKQMIDDREYIHTTWKTLTIGKVTSKERECLSQC